VIAELISIGTELTAGLAVDTNTAWLASRLAACGVETRRHVTVTDERAAIAEEVARATSAADIVIVTGGLGPTEDDLTRQAVADALGVDLERHPAVLAQVRAFFDRRALNWMESNARQAEFPAGTTPIQNDWGTAPGFRARFGRAVLFCVPGVPREMREMFEHAILPELRDLGIAGATAIRTLRCFGAGEARMGERIADLMCPGRDTTVGITADEGIISVRIIARAAAPEEAAALADRDAVEISARLGNLVFGRENDTLASAVGALLRSRGWRLATAESCTGGLLAKLFTDVPGSSDHFLCSAVTYSDQAKTDLLGVDPRLVAEHGAVSEQVGRAMAAACLARAGADAALATTGIAGPGGGSAEKPVGLVYIGLATAAGCEVRQFQFGAHLSRASIRQRTCLTALNMLRTRLLG